MRYFVILAWCVSLAAALYSKDISWHLGSVLQARQFGSHLNFPQALPLQKRNGFTSLPRFSILQRRMGQPPSARPVSPPRKGRSRSVSPTVRAHVRAIGPATISMTGGQGEQNHLIPVHKPGFIQDKHRSQIKAGAKSNGLFPLGTALHAEAKGGVVMAQVIPHIGGIGHIQFHGNGHTREIAIHNQDGQWHSAVTPGTEKATVRAQTLGGGEVNVFAYNEDKGK